MYRAMALFASLQVNNTHKVTESFKTHSLLPQAEFLQRLHLSPVSIDDPDIKNSIILGVRKDIHL